jgi:hypothetical protein
MQAIGRVAFAIVPELLDGIEFGGVGRELFEMEAGVGALDLLARRPFVNRASIPAEDDVTPHLGPQPPQTRCHLAGRAVGRLEAEIQSHVLAV